MEYHKYDPNESEIEITANFYPGEPALGPDDPRGLPSMGEGESVELLSITLNGKDILPTLPPEVAINLKEQAELHADDWNIGEEGFDEEAAKQERIDYDEERGKPMLASSNKKKS